MAAPDAAADADVSFSSAASSSSSWVLHDVTVLKLFRPLSVAMMLSSFSTARDEGEEDWRSRSVGGHRSTARMPASNSDCRGRHTTTATRQRRGFVVGSSS